MFAAIRRLTVLQLVRCRNKAIVMDAQGPLVTMWADNASHTHIDRNDGPYSQEIAQFDRLIHTL